MTIWASSDWHLGHANIIKYCDRPWKNVVDMNAGLIANHNKLVAPNDDVYLIGDLCMGRVKETIHLLHHFNGRKHLVLGNHDYRLESNKEFARNFIWIRHYHELVVKSDDDNKQKFVMSHYPMSSWNGSFHGSVMLHGHVHGSENSSDRRIYDVGVDANDYQPVSLNDIAKWAESRSFGQS